MAMAKKPLTVAELARIGGLARKEKLSPERRLEIARKAGKAAGRVHKAKAAKRKKESW